ncbi:MAG: NAD(P)/FAD-dependent oxidoreductase [Myxococcales bacterium]|nr:NAD(P)/FAD-dependent oxidoreductase [Myxococcales bacterium]
MRTWSPTAETGRRARTTPPEVVDVAIVGCGLGGLATGAILTRAGLRVACFDAHYVAGGCATMFARKSVHGHFHFDVGLHYIGDCGPQGTIPRVLRAAGVEPDLVPLDADGFDIFSFPDMEFRAPVGHDAFEARLLDAFPAERRGIQKYMGVVRQLDWFLGRLDAHDGRTTPVTLLQAPFRAPGLLRWGRAPVSALLDACTRDPRLRAVLLGPHGDYGLPPSRVAALLHVGLQNHYLRGAFYPRGGGQAFADALAAQIEAGGGTVHLRLPIEQILVEDGRAVGVRTEARHGLVHTTRAAAVVANADLRETVTRLVDPAHWPAGFVRRVEGFTWPAGIFMTCLGVEGPIPGLGNANHWLFDHYDTERMYREASPQKPVGAYITSATGKDPESPHHAPEGCSTVEIMTLVPGDPRVWGVEPDAIHGWKYRKTSAYADLKAATEANLIERFKARFPEAGPIVYQESASPVTHSRFTRATLGTSYGIAASPDQFMQHRPGPRSPLPGLYLCGASTRSGHGIAGALASGAVAAAVVKKDQAATGSPGRARAGAARRG